MLNRFGIKPWRQLYSDTLLRRQAVRVGLVIHSIGWGVGYAFGPESLRSSRSLELLHNFWVPIQVWGVFAIVLGFLYLTPRRDVAHAIAHVFWALWALCIAATVFTGDLDAWGAPWNLVVVALVHLRMVDDEGERSTLDFTNWKALKP